MLPRLGQETVPNQFLTRQVTLPTQDRFAVAQHSSRSFPTGNCSAQALPRQRRRGGLLLALSPLKQGDCFQDANISQVHALDLPMSPEGTCLCFLMTFYSPKCAHMQVIMGSFSQPADWPWAPANALAVLEVCGRQWKGSSRGAGFIVTFVYHFLNNIEICLGRKCSAKYWEQQLTGR